MLGNDSETEKKTNPLGISHSRPHRPFRFSQPAGPWHEKRRALGTQDFEVLDFRTSGHFQFKMFKKFETGFRGESLKKSSIVLIFHFPADHQALLREHFSSV